MPKRSGSGPTSYPRISTKHARPDTREGEDLSDHAHSKCAVDSGQRHALPQLELLRPELVEIGNPDLIAKRAPRRVPIAPGGTLSDYVPFYFTPLSPMLYNIKTGYGVKMRPMSDIAIFVTSLHKLVEEEVPFVFTDRHAYLSAARFSSDLNDLDRVRWPILRERDFKRDPDDPGKFEQYQAEALIRDHLPVSALRGIVCHGSGQVEKIQKEMESRSITLKVVSIPDWYF